MRNTLTIGVLALAVIVIGAFVFLRGPNNFSNENSAAAVAVPFTELAHGTQSTIGRRVNYLIASPEQFRELWELIGAEEPLPDIDFSESAVAAVFAGEKPAAGYDIAVSRVEDADARTITITLTEPGSDCVLAQVITAPYQVIKLPGTTLKLVHEDISTTVSCPE